jgi:hypothetical protein
MTDKRPNYSLKSVSGQRDIEKPDLFLVRYFQIKDADYMKPPLSEHLLEPDGNPAPTPTSTAGVVSNTACTCNVVCICVPVSTCTCNTICTCNTVSTSYGVSTSGGGGGGGGYGGYGGYWVPCH